MTTAKRFKVLRILKNKTQQKLAAEVGVTQPLISMVETGKILPSGEMRERFATALGIDNADDLFGPEMERRT